MARSPPMSRGLGAQDNPAYRPVTTPLALTCACRITRAAAAAATRATAERDHASRRCAGRPAILVSSFVRWVTADTAGSEKTTLSSHAGNDDALTSITAVHRGQRVDISSMTT